MQDSSASDTTAPAGAVAIVGAGSIGTAWATLFSGAGRTVLLHDPDPERLRRAVHEAAAALGGLSRAGLLAGEPAEAARRIMAAGRLEDAVGQAGYVQECAPEDVVLKTELFAALDEAAPPDAVIASSSSFLPASAFASNLPGRSRILVVHPGNPPTLLRIAEIVPAPFTDPACVGRTRALLEDCGMSTVVVRREVEGFVFNRLQGALLREAWALVADGVAEPDEIDRIVRNGLGLRWAAIGPFETSDLNTRGGIRAHAARMLPAYARMGEERGMTAAPWTPEVVDRVVADRRARLPLEGWAERVAWRDRILALLLAARRKGDDA
ncbi:MAG: 3-hydroxyacyl-CoA dehydrogenase [Alsobacter sp.]